MAAELEGVIAGFCVARDVCGSGRDSPPKEAGVEGFGASVEGVLALSAAFGEVDGKLGNCACGSLSSDTRLNRGWGFGVVSTALFNLLNKPPDDELPAVGVFAGENSPPLETGCEESPKLKRGFDVMSLGFASSP